MGARLSSSKPCHCRCRYSSVCLLTSRKADTRRPGEPALSNITPTDPFGDRCCRDTASRIHRAPSNEDGVCVHHHFQLSGRSRSVKRAARLIACAGLIAAGKKRRSWPGTSREKTRRGQLRLPFLLPYSPDRDTEKLVCNHLKADKIVRSATVRDSAPCI